MNVGDTGRIRWVRVGRFLLAATPVHGQRVYRFLGRREQARILRLEAWEPDVALWGARPDEVLTDYPGRHWRGGPSDGKLAGLAETEDTYLSEWAPNSAGDEGVPPESQFFHPAGLNMVTDLDSNWKRTKLTFTDRELVIRFHEAKGRPLITCGWCEAKERGRDLQKLLRWFRVHDCITTTSTDNK